MAAGMVPFTLWIAIVIKVHSGLLGAELAAPEAGRGLRQQLQLASGAELGVGGIGGEVERVVQPPNGGLERIRGALPLAPIELGEPARAHRLERPLPSGEPLQLSAQRVCGLPLEILRVEQREALIDVGEGRPERLVEHRRTHVPSVAMTASQVYPTC